MKIIKEEDILKVIYIKVCELREYDQLFLSLDRSLKENRIIDAFKNENYSFIIQSEHLHPNNYRGLYKIIYLDNKNKELLEKVYQLDRKNKIIPKENFIKNDLMTKIILNPEEELNKLPVIINAPILIEESYIIYLEKTLKDTKENFKVQPKLLKQYENAISLIKENYTPIISKIKKKRLYKS